MYIGLHIKYRYSSNILVKLELYRQIFAKYTNITFHEDPFSGNRDFTCGRTDGRTDRRKTDMTELTVAFLNFAYASNSCYVFSVHVLITVISRI